MLSDREEKGVMSYADNTGFGTKHEEDHQKTLDKLLLF